jgi:hypothetical protein
MSATTIGMYNTQQVTISTTNGSNQKLFNQYAAQETRIEGLIKSKQKSLDRYNILIMKYDSDDKKKDYNAIDSNIKAAEAYITQQTNELQKVTAKKESILLTDTAIIVGQKDAYTIMGAWWGLSPDAIRFLISVLYAIFIDIIAPVATGLSLFMNNSRR